MMTDYVLPFDRKFEHKIWDILLKDIMYDHDVINDDTERRNLREKNDIFSKVRKNMEKNKKVVNEDGMKWKWSHGMKTKGIIRGITTIDVLSVWNKKEKQMINDKNALDNVLYKLAAYIADVDVLFHDLLQKDDSQSIFIL